MLVLALHRARMGQLWSLIVALPDTHVCAGGRGREARRVVSLDFVLLLGRT